MVTIKGRDSNLLTEIRAIKAEIARLQGLLAEASAELHGQPAGMSPASKRAVAANRTRRGYSAAPGELVEGSAAFLAAGAIRAAGRPLHAKELVRAIEEQGQKIKETT